MKGYFRLFCMSIVCSCNHIVLDKCRADRHTNFASLLHLTSRTVLRLRGESPLPSSLDALISSSVCTSDGQLDF